MTNLDAFYEYWRTWFAQSSEAKDPFRRVKGPCAACEGGGSIFVDMGGPTFADTHCPDCGGKGRIDTGNWYPPGGESPGYTGKPDPKEYFHWTLKDITLAEREESTSFHQTAEVFWDCWEKAAWWLENSGLHELGRVIRPNDCVLRILHYLPTADGLAGEAHRDFDLLTVNVGGTCPGLEIRHPTHLSPLTGEWQGAPAWVQQEGGIHVGEMLEIYTNPDGYPRASRSMGQFNATPHRVRLPPNTERFAAVFFILPPAGFALRPGLTKEQYLTDRMGKAGTAGGAKR